MPFENEAPVAARICVVRKSKAAIAQAIKKLDREASKKGSNYSLKLSSTPSTSWCSRTARGGGGGHHGALRPACKGSFVPEVSDHRWLLSFFVMVLAFGRKMYLEFIQAKTLEHFLFCHQHAYDYFGADRWHECWWT